MEPYPTQGVPTLARGDDVVLVAKARMASATACQSLTVLPSGKRAGLSEQPVGTHARRPVTQSLAGYHKHC